MTALWMTLFNTAFWVGLHFGTAFIITALPKPLQTRMFDPQRPFFRVKAREMIFYRSIRLNRWKDRLPQFNRDFDKRHFRSDWNAAYLETFLFNTCRAEIIHEAIGVLGFLSLLFCLAEEHPAEYLPLYGSIAAFFLLCNLPFALIQRYNRCRLLRLREHTARCTSRFDSTYKKTGHPIG
ncbi:hypothetical protein H8711_11615 [Clostridiaceae bacterium NSJ-31]|uniref:Glycosyl-4,4'-diaponeurosporenoate acyltransferase n=1 Tax=Ligaoa zhengdingensis TaxID=2763658 RepID=A0A926E0K2_9FIRM|nr:hypothetical protein [Ligaoa zhengdingensis]MBC8547571.1 hypothetical protein [Ligaoa zhengdingensis]